MKESTVETDRSVFDFEGFKSRCLGNLAFVERVLGSFTKQLDSDLEKLEQALLASDAAAFALVAHRIKGMSANVEARSLYENATIAEERALENHPVELFTHLAQMRSDRDRLVDAFAKVNLTGVRR